MEAGAPLVRAFDDARRRLFAVAYRMLGSVAEAEDVVQDAWLRWKDVDPAEVRDATGYLVTTTTRLAINRAQSARARRETYVGPWLPEPVDTSHDPELGAMRAEALDLALLLVLDMLTPTERAAYVLREAFEYEYDVIATIVQTTPANARQLVTRARQHLAERRRVRSASDEQRRILVAFVDAAKRGDVTALEALLAEDATSLTDGNGAQRAARHPVRGRERVARFVAGFAEYLWTGSSIEWLEVNGQLAVLVQREGMPPGVATVASEDGKITQIFWWMNQEKVGRLLAVPRATPAV